MVLILYWWYTDCIINEWLCRSHISKGMNDYFHMWLVSRRHCFFMTKRECGERTTPTLPLYSTVYCLDSLFTAKNLTSKLWPPISMHFIEMFLCNIWNSCHVVNTFGSLRLLIKYPLWEPYFWYHWFTLASYVTSS